MRTMSRSKEHRMKKNCNRKLNTERKTNSMVRYFCSRKVVSNRLCLTSAIPHTFFSQWVKFSQCCPQTLVGKILLIEIKRGFKNSTDDKKSRRAEYHSDNN